MGKAGEPVAFAESRIIHRKALTLARQCYGNDCDPEVSAALSILILPMIREGARDPAALAERAADCLRENPDILEKRDW